MIGRRGRSAGLAALALMAAALAGCASRPAPVTCLPPGRSLVLARVVSDENRANQEAVADLLVNALRDAGYVIGSRELLAEARAVGLGAWAGATLERVQRGAVLSAEEGRVMAERFDVRTLIATDLNEYDQVWGKYAKFTRAGVDAQATDLGSDRVLWRIHGDTDVEDMRGRAFRYAMEQAVQQLAGSICPKLNSFSFANLWRSWRR